MQVAHILARKGNVVRTIDHRQSVREAARLMHVERIGAVIVVNEQTGMPMGMVSQSEIVGAIHELGQSALSQCATGIMRRPTPHCAADTTVQTAMAQMTRERARHLAVLDGDGMLIGLVSLGDLVAARLGAMELETNVLRDMARSTLMAA